MNIWELARRRAINAKELIRIAVASGIPAPDEWAPLNGDDVQRIDEELRKRADEQRSRPTARTALLPAMPTPRPVPPQSLDALPKIVRFLGSEGLGSGRRTGSGLR